MTKKPRIKQCVTAVTMTALLWSGSAWTAAPVSAAANPFGDVKTGHWAEKHVVKLALQGIILGADGNFRPSESVRREDAVIVALKFMGLADNIDKSVPVTLPSTFKVDDYAIHYVQEAFNHKLLNAEEEFALATEDKGNPWGKAPASREWVAKLLIRAIGMEDDAAANAGKATAFSDDSKIDVNFRPYVLTAIQQQLVAGKTPTTFEPKQPITRAEIATLFSKAESKVNVGYSGQVTGVLLSIDADKLTVLHDDGSTHVYTLTPDTMFARFDSDKPANLASLKQYGKAVLIHDANGAIGYVEQTDDNAYITTVNGIFSKVNSADSKIWLSIGDNFKDYNYGQTLTVTDAQGKPIRLSDIPEGSAVSLMVDTVRTEGKVVAVKVNQSVVNKNGSGIVTAWNPSAGTLQVSDIATGDPETLPVSPTATYKQDDVFVKADQLKVGYTVEYEVKAGVVISVKFAKPAVTTVTGKLFEVDKSNRTIQYTDSGKLTAKFLADTTPVEIQGLIGATLDDLQKGDDISMVLDSNDKVIKITVNGRSVQYLTGATVAAYIADINQLTLKDAAGIVHNFVLNSNVRYDLNGLQIDATQALTRLTTGKKVTVSYSGSNAVTIYFVAKYTGSVLENNATTKKLTIRLDASNTVTVPYSYPYVDIYGKPSTSIADVKVGDQVIVLLNDTQDQITSIQVQNSAQFEVASVDAAASKIRIKKSGTSTTEEWTVPATALLQDENGTAVTLGQFAVGSVVNVTFSGKFTMLKIKAVTKTYGKVAAVNMSASTVDLVMADGTVVTKTLGTSPMVVRDNTTLSSLANVQVNDRVEIRKDENDRSVIEIIPAVQKTFWQYVSSNNSIQVRRSNFTDPYIFPLSSKTVIHQGTNVINASQLMDGDAISLYFLRGELVEISK